MPPLWSMTKMINQSEFKPEYGDYSECQLFFRKIRISPIQIFAANVMNFVTS